MNKNAAAKAALVLSLIALGACGDEGSRKNRLTGTVRFSLEVPASQTVTKVDVHLVCVEAAVDLTKTLDVVRGDVVAVFGGLTPGACTVTMSSKTTVGASCLGTQNFVVVASTVTDVPVGLLCNGRNEKKDGSVRITATIETKDCSKDRIKVVYASPASVLLGESTTVQAEIYPANSVGTPKYSWLVRNDATETATGTLATVPCADGSATCTSLTCTGLGSKTMIDPRTGYPAAGAFVALQYEDDDCLDTEEVWLTCMQSSVCGNGIKDGVEQCDDANVVSNDGCSATCKLETCGDGVVQISEQCDGTAGVPAGQTCSATCKLSSPSSCGDGLLNQGTEQCDGTAGLLANQQCGADCKIVPICGNQIVEAPELCDSNAATCVNCVVVTTMPPPPPPPPQGNACSTCIAAIPDIGAFNDSDCQTNALCKSALSCVLAHPTCWNGVANLACYCGVTQANVDGCEVDAFVPVGPCATEIKAASGTNPKNSDVTARYFDFAYPVGTAMTIVDAANTSCKAQCF